MKDLKIYHWTAFIIPGFVFLIGIIIICSQTIGLEVQDSSYEPSLINSNNIGATVFLGIIVGLLSYPVGMLLWGFSYSAVPFGLLVGYNWYGYWWKRLILRRQVAEPHYQHRMSQFRSIYAKINNKGMNKEQINSLFPDTEEGYRKFQLMMFHIMEQSHQYVGPRLSSEWEVLGLLLSLSSAFSMLGILSLILLLGDAVPEANRNTMWMILILSITSNILAVIGYRYRNKIVGRDVAYGKLVNENSINWKPLKDAITLCIDFDGVIADTNTKKVEIAETRKPKVRKEKKDAEKFDLTQGARSFCVPIIGEELYNEISQLAYSNENTEKILPVKGAIESITDFLNKGFHTYVVTSRKGDSFEACKIWMWDKFGNTSPTIISSTQASKSKAQIAGELQADVIIDDDPIHLPDKSDEGLLAILFSPPIDYVPKKGIMIARTWEQVGSLLRQAFSGCEHQE